MATPASVAPGVSGVAAPALTLFDERSFFEKALAYGLSHGLIGQQRIEAMEDEAARGMVQIARYFGSEYLRPELERALARMINMISLGLRVQSGADLRRAAEMLRDNSLLSRSKTGSDMLKALIVMPQSSHFGMNEQGAFSDRHVPQLARWSLASFEQYQAELNARDHAVLAVRAALHLAEALGLQQEVLQDAGADADAVIRTALLASAQSMETFPDWTALEALLQSWRKKSSDASALTKTVQRLSKAMKPPSDLEPRAAELVRALRDSVIADLPKLLGVRTPLRKLLDQTPAFMGRYFWLEDALGEVHQLDAQRSEAWDKLTKGLSDDATVLTLLLCVSAGQTPKTRLSEKTAAALVRRWRKNGLEPQRAHDWLNQHAPAHYIADCQALWQGFCEHASQTLLDAHDKTLRSALRLLRAECNISSA